MEVNEKELGANQCNEEPKLVFGQLLIGPPGSGKSTFCKVMYNLMKELDRNVFIINLDPGNDIDLPYDASINICQLVRVNDIMEAYNLGPNGALINAMNFLYINYEWLIFEIQKIIKNVSNPYILIDAPGQVELYIHDSSLKDVINKLNSKNSFMDLRLVVVNLVDSFYANDPGKYISALFTSLSSMFYFELPHINILSKLDLFEKYKKNSFNLDFYCEVLSLEYLLETINEDIFFKKYKNFNKALIDLIENSNLVSFIPVDINNKKTVLNALNHIDRSNGFFLVRIETEKHMLRFYTDYTELSGNDY